MCPLRRRCQVQWHGSFSACGHVPQPVQAPGYKTVSSAVAFTFTLWSAYLDNREKKKNQGVGSGFHRIQVEMGVRWGEGVCTAGSYLNKRSSYIQLDHTKALMGKDLQNRHSNCIYKV